MTKKSTIKYISDLMDNPARLTSGDQSSIGGLRQSFPYFVPVRYLDAVSTHRESPYSPAMLSAISPYMGNWMLFSDFMDASLQTVADEVVDTSSAQEPEKLPEVVAATSTLVEQDTVTITNDVLEEKPTSTSATYDSKESEIEVAANSTLIEQDTVTTNIDVHEETLSATSATYDSNQSEIEVAATSTLEEQDTVTTNIDVHEETLSSTSATYDSKESKIEVAATSTLIEQDALTTNMDVHEEILSSTSATYNSKESEIEVVASDDSDAASDDREQIEETHDASEVTEVDIVPEIDVVQITPVIAEEEEVITNEPAIIEDVLPEEIQVIENVSEKEIILPTIVEEELVIATEPAIIENSAAKNIDAIENSAAAELLLPAEIAEEILTEAEQSVTNITTTPEITTTVIEQAETNKTVDVMAATNDIENTPDITTSDIEKEHKNFWSQGEEETTEPTDEDKTQSSVAPPIPDHLPIKKTPAPEPTVQSQIPEEEFRPTQHSRQEKPLIYPIYTEDYFLQQGEKISPVLPTDIGSLKTVETAEEAAKSLMVMMSFSEWLLHFKSSTEKLKEETKDQRALKTMWQKEKLAAAIEEENEEIPENVFEMAVNSITKEDGLASESLADIYIKQGKLDKAIDMYRKLSLRNPQKNAYFARKIEEILKEKQL